MQITKPVIYGVQALQQLDKEGMLTREGIARRLDISIAYSARVCGALKKAGLVTASRAPGSGYSLAKPLKEITIAEMVRGMEGELIDAEEGDTDDMLAIRLKLNELLMKGGWGRPVSSLIRRQ